MYMKLLQSIYSRCSDSCLEQLVHAASSSSSSTATVQTAAWNSRYMRPAQALPLQPLFRQQPGTVGTCGQLKLFLYSRCSDSSLEQSVHVASSSSSSTATVQTAAWNMQPAQALPLQPLFRQQPGTVGTCGQLKLFLNMHKTELYRKSFNTAERKTGTHIPRQSKILKTNKELYYSVHVAHSFRSISYCFV